MSFIKHTPIPIFSTGVILTPPVHNPFRPLFMIKDGEGKMVNPEDFDTYLADGWVYMDEDLFSSARDLDECKDPEEKEKLKKTLLEKVLSEGPLSNFPPLKDPAIGEEIAEEAIRQNPPLISLWWKEVERMTNLKLLITLACRDEDGFSLIPYEYKKANPEFWFRYKCSDRENIFWGIKKHKNKKR